MSEPIYVYIGTYADEQAAKSDLEVVRDLYGDGVLRTYDAAVVTKEADQKVHVRRHEHTAAHSAWHGAAVGALVGVLFPPAFIVSTVVAAAAGGLVGHLWHGLSRDDLKELGEWLDAGEASLVVISTTEIDHALTTALKSTAHQIKKLEVADLKAFEAELKSVSAD